MIRVLSILLALQLVVTVLLYWPQSDDEGAATVLLPQLEAGAVTTIEIAGAEDSVTLTRDGERWLLDSGLPADGAKVTALLSALLENDPGFAIANSDSAAGRFEVAEDNFERRIALSAGGESRVAYLGTSPAFRKIHARAADSAAIHVLELNSYDAPTAAASWLDRGLLEMAGVDAVAVNGVALDLEGDRWVSGDLAAVDPEAMEDLVQGLAGLRVSGLANAEDEALAQNAAPAVTLEASSGGRTTTLTILEAEERYFARSSGYDALFTLGAYDAERIVDAVDALLDAGDDDAPAEDEGGDDGEASGEDEAPES